MAGVHLKILALEIVDDLRPFRGNFRTLVVRPDG
jgi:hypothetical protein